MSNRFFGRDNDVDRSCALDLSDRPVPVESVPYQLQRRFTTVVVPLLVIALLGLLIAVSHAVSRSVERAYVAEVVQKHRSVMTLTEIAGRVETLLPSGSWSLEAHGAIAKALEGEAREMGFDCLAMIRTDGSTIASTGAHGCSRTAFEQWKADGTGKPLFIEDDGPPTHWIVVTQSTSGGTNDLVVLVSSQQAAVLERLLDVDTLVWAFVIGIPFLMAIGLASRFVSKAQAQIDLQTRSLHEARESVASFVSHSTRVRAQSSSSKARRVEATLLFLDVRDFSSFAERSSPDEAADLVSEIAGVAFTAVMAAGGDVDRLVGDGLLAWFEGDDRREHAWAAAEAILLGLARADLPRGVGLGLHDGIVVEAEIGDDRRRDATLLGNSVNVTARLCSLAGAGEAIASEEMGTPLTSRLRYSALSSFEIKGHRKTVLARNVCLAS